MFDSYRMPVFPYSQVSPPPTAGPLTIVDRANETTPYSGGGGGGGGAGPNPSVSSLSVIGNGNIVFTTSGTLANTGAILFNTTPAGTTANWFGYYQVGDETGTQNTELCLIQGPVPGPGSYSLQNIGVHGVFFGDQAGVGPGAYLSQDPTDAGGIYVSSLRVSSINGAAPGGGSVGPNPSFSSVAVAGNLQVSSINGSTPGGGGGLNILVSSISVPSPGSTDLTIIGPGSYSIVFDQPGGAFGQGISFPGGTYTSEVRAFDTIMKLGAGEGGIVVPVSISSLIYNTATGVGATLSTLNVSSINNAAPGGGSAPFFSTLFNGNSTINCDGLVNQNLLAFSTTANHLYQIQTQMTIAPRAGGGQPGTLDDDVVQEIFNEINMNVTSGAVISSLFAVSRNIDIGTMGMWKATTTGAALNINASFSTTANMTSVVLADFGAV